MSGMGPNGGMIFPPSWFGGRWTDAEETEIEAREQLEEEQQERDAFLESLPEAHEQGDE